MKGSVKAEPSTSKGKGKQVVFIEEDSSEPEFLHNIKPEPVATKKRKADDEGTMVVRKKPTEIISTPAKGTAARNQETAHTLVGKLIDNTNPARMEQMATARQETSMATALIMGKDTQIAELQRDISNMRERHDREIRDIRDRHDRKIHQEREARIQAEHKYAHAQSVITMLNMLGVGTGAAPGSAIATLAGSGILNGGMLPPASNAMPAANPPLPPVNPQPVAANQVADTAILPTSNSSHSGSAYNLAGPSSEPLQDPHPAGSAEATELATN
ncbi:hypothetical protein FRC09_004208 [Ceratobasidium sp. 395]|nr:hypothetical protein FRC09_004208 [Ceratobasidium sp. 395]